MTTIQHSDTPQQPGKPRTGKFQSTSEVVTFAFRGPRDLKRRVDVIAASRQVSLATVCIEALEQYATEAEQKIETARQALERLRGGGTD